MCARLDTGTCSIGCPADVNGTDSRPCDKFGERVVEVKAGAYALQIAAFDPERGEVEGCCSTPPPVAAVPP